MIFDTGMKINLSDVAKRMVVVVCISAGALVAAGIACVWLFPFFPFMFGVLLGAAVNILKIIMLERAVNKAVEMEEKRAANYLRLQYLLRYVITGAVLAAAALIPPINLWGAVAGVFTMPIATFFARKVL